MRIEPPRKAPVAWDRWFWGIAAVVVASMALTWSGSATKLETGSRATVRHRDGKGAWFGVDDDAYDALIDSENRRSGDALGDLIKKGQAFREPNGSQVRVLRMSLGSCFVQVVAGANEGATGWVQQEMLAPATDHD